MEKLSIIKINKIDKVFVLKIISSILFLIMALIIKSYKELSLIFFIFSYIVIGGDVLFHAFKNVIKGSIFDENFLMSIATLGAFAIKEYPEAVAVMLFYQIGELLQDAAVDKSRSSIEDLLKIRPDFANLVVDNEIIKTRPEEMQIGDLIVIKPGEKVPLDGKVVEGTSTVNTSSLTGESVPVLVKKESEVLSGFINMDGLLKVEVTRRFEESALSKILEVVENAASKKAPTERFITRFAKYYTPVVIVIALFIAIMPQFITGTFSSVWIYRALLFLVISCPCALVVSIPLGFFGGIGAASKNGILIKGSDYLEGLSKLEVVAFDKTGTLTEGAFEVTSLKSENGFLESDVLEHAAYAEYYSNHPIALAVLNYYKNKTGKDILKDAISDHTDIPGYGIKAIVNDVEIIAGNLDLMVKEGIPLFFSDSNRTNSVNTLVHIAINSKYAGFISVADALKADSAKTIKSLKAMGVKRTVMLTGDNINTATHVGNAAGVNEVHANLLPHQKVEILEYLSEQKSKKGKIAFVGDGINDAPVLARADIGIAMGGLGSDAAIEAADVVLMKDEPSKLIKAIQISKKTKTIVVQNIIIALGVKVAILLLGALGIASMWEAVFADVGVALFAILNSMRTLKYKPV